LKEVQLNLNKFNF